MLHCNKLSYIIMYMFNVGAEWFGLTKHTTRLTQGEAKWNLILNNLNRCST